MAVGLLVAGGVAYATIPSDGVITTCYTRSGGALRVIDPGVTKCKSAETQLAWSVDGQDGVSGYEIVTEDSLFDPNTTSSFGGVTAECPAGKKALGGGGVFIEADLTPVSFGSLAITASFPSADGTGWSVFYSAPLIDADYVAGVRAYATCATMG